MWSGLQRNEKKTRNRIRSIGVGRERGPRHVRIHSILSYFYKTIGECIVSCDFVSKFNPTPEHVNGLEKMLKRKIEF